MRCLVLYSHPNPASFCAATRDAAIATLRSRGHEVRLTDLYADGFEPSLCEHERRTHFDPDARHGLERYTTDLQWAEALIFVYPTWWSGQPAMLKGWFDRVWQRGVAWDLEPGGPRLQPLLSNVRRIVAITTHGSSKWKNALQGESGKRTLTRSIRTMCAKRTRSTWCALYGMDTSAPADREAFLIRVERALAKL